MRVCILDQGNDLSAYLAEILQTWGLAAHTVTEPAGLSGLTPDEAQVVICARAPRDSRTSESLLAYVQRGGRLFAFLPDGPLAAAAGLQPAGSCELPLRLRLTHRPAAGLDGELLPVVGRAAAYESSRDATVLAYLSHPRRYEGERVGVVQKEVGPGRITAFAFDLPLCVLLLRQGDPDRAERFPAADPAARPSHLAADFDPGDAAWVPHADLLARWLVDLVRGQLAWPAPMLWHLPRAASGLLLYSGDEDGAEVDWVREEMEYLHDHGARMNLYIIPTQTHSTRAHAQQYARHHDVGPHPDIRSLDGQSIAVRMAEFERQIRMFEHDFGMKARSLRAHGTAWAGYLDPVEVMARVGVHMDGNYFSGTFRRHRDPAPYAAFGGAMPMRFAYPAGGVLPVYQQHTPLADDVMFGPGDYSYRYTPETFAVMSGRIFDDMVHRFHMPFAVCIHPSNWVRFSGVQGQTLVRHAGERGVPVWSFDQWLAFWEARDTWRYRDVKWDGCELQLRAAGDAAPGGMHLALPATHGGAGLGEVLMDGVAPAVERARRYREMWALVPVPTGSHEVTLTARYSPARR